MAKMALTLPPGQILGDRGEQVVLIGGCLLLDILDEGQKFTSHEKYWIETWGPRCEAHAKMAGLDILGVAGFNTLASAGLVVTEKIQRDRITIHQDWKTIRQAISLKYHP